jgi:phosphoribosylformylglycinamidine synthase
MNNVCRALETPIISGNVSFYNETEGRNITPTPSTGVVGLRPSVNRLPKSHFNNVGESVYLLRWPLFTSTGVLGENAAEVKAIGSVTTPEALSQLKSACQTLRHLTKDSDGLVSASRVVGKFGLAYALAKMTLKNKIGIQVSEESLDLLRWNQNDRRSISNLLFCENNYEVILVSKEDPKAFAAQVKNLGCPFVIVIGKTGGDQLELGKDLSLPLKVLNDTYENGWVKAFKSLPAKG